MDSDRTALRRAWVILAAAVLGLTALAARAAQVIEFYNTNLDNYFITADANEAAAVDSGGAGPGWTRTGDTFAEGGIDPVCRFYGSIMPGPNSHFYTANVAECELLKQLQLSTPATQKRWNFESLDFLTTAAPVGFCPAGTVPVYRAFNNGPARGIDSNHRITTSLAGIQEVVARGWISEGIVLCGATEESVTATEDFWEQVKGVWTTGSASNPVVIRIEADGGYLQGTTTAAGTAHPGLERGRLAFDPLTKHFNGVAVQDTDGTGGLSGRGDAIRTQTVAVEGGAIVVREAGGAESYRMQRLATNMETLVGAWALETRESLATQHFVFFANGRVMMIDPVGDVADPGQTSCGGPGVEYGTYTWNGATGTLTITGITIDTNGCAGLNEPPSPNVLFGPGDHSISGIVLGNDGFTLIAPDNVVLVRLTP